MTDPGREPQANIGETGPVIPDMTGLIGVLDTMARLRLAEGQLAEAQALYRERVLAGHEAVECSVTPLSARTLWAPTRLVGYNEHGQPAADFLIEQEDQAVSQATPFEAQHTGIRYAPPHGKEETMLIFSRPADAADVKGLVPEGDRATRLNLTWWLELRVPEHLWGDLAIKPPEVKSAPAPQWLGKKVIATQAPIEPTEAPGGIAGTGTGRIH